MKHLRRTLILLCVAASAHGYHNGAGDTTSTPDERASCNASFHDGCQQPSGSTLSSSGFAAPAGVLGGSLLESASLLAMVVLAVAPRRRRASRSAAKQEQPAKDDSRAAPR